MKNHSVIEDVLPIDEEDNKMGYNVSRLNTKDQELNLIFIDRQIKNESE